tara:strand:+ start:730 stop:1074 length:345 start_codon:yes stop_codon:yes gene_type:complete
MVNKERFIDLWNDPTITQAEIAAEFLITTGAVTKLAQAWDLTFPRPMAKKTKKQKNYVPTPEEIKEACERIQEKKLKEYGEKADKSHQKQERRTRNIYSYHPAQRYFSSREGLD